LQIYFLHLFCLSQQLGFFCQSGIVTHAC
jgi:hypothetical protein